MEDDILERKKGGIDGHRESISKIGNNRDWVGAMIVPGDHDVKCT